MRIGKIEKGVQPPPSRYSGRYAHILEKLNINESIMIRTDPGENFYQLTNVLAAAMSRYGKKSNKIFVYRTLMDDEGYGLRIWRVESK